MRTTPTPSLRLPPIQLHAVAQRLTAWRARRKPGRRIPEELWNAATELARVHGLSPTATALKLSYYDLQRRLRPGGARSQDRPPPKFVELPPRGPVTDPGTLELLRPSGARLTIRLPHANPRQLLPLVQAFLRS
ncbi:MAG: hypothetical protein ACREI1_04325 [Nitrospiraceae bacterium]